MAGERTAAPTQAAAPAPAGGSGRLLFVDNIRIFLTLLVILHHLAIIYTGQGAGSTWRAGRTRSATPSAPGFVQPTRPTSWGSFC